MKNILATILLVFMMVAPSFGWHVAPGRDGTDFSAFCLPLGNNMDDSKGDLANGSYTRQSDFTYTDGGGTLRYGRASRENLWVNSDPAPTLGSEEFPGFTGDTWTEGIGWTEGVGFAESDGTQIANSSIHIPGVITNGADYLIQFEVYDYQAGAVKPWIGAGTGDGTLQSGNGTYIQKLTAGSASIYFTANLNFIGKIRNVSIREYTAPTGFTISETYSIPYDWGVEGLTSAVVFGDNSASRNFRQIISFTEGVSYLVACFIEMDDGSVPDITFSTTDGDALLYVTHQIGQNISIVHVSGNIYRISAYRTAVTTSSVLTFGIDKRIGHSSKGFKVSGFQAEELPSANVLGAELGDDAAEDNTAVWTEVECVLSFDTDHYVVTETNATQWIARENIEFNKYYQFSYTIKDGTGTGVTIEFRYGDDSTPTGIAHEAVTSATWETYSGQFFSGSDGDFFSIFSALGSGETYLIKDISVKEIPAYVVEHSTLGEELGASISWTDNSSGSGAVSGSNPWTFFAPDGDNAQLVNSTALTADKYYFITYDLDLSSGGFDIGENYSRISRETTSGSYELVFQCTAPSGFYLGRQSGEDNLFTVSNFTIKEIIDPAIQPAPYTVTTDSTALLPADNPIEADGFAFMGSPAVNLIPYSEDFSSGVGWAHNNITTSTSDEFAPDGISLATVIAEDEADNKAHQLNLGFPQLEENTSYNFSVFVKPIRTLRLFRLLVATYANYLTTIMSFSTGQIIETSAGVSASIDDLGDYYRLNMTFNSGSGANSKALYCGFTDGVSHLYEGDGEANAVIWGAQLTEGSQLQPYIPTDGIPTAMMPTEDVRWTMSDKLKGILGDTTAAAAAGVDAGEGTVILDWTPGFDEDDIVGTGSVGILSPIESPNRLMHQYDNNGSIVFYFRDEIGAATPDTNPSKPPYEPITIVQSFSAGALLRDVGVKINGTWSWGNDKAFNGSFIPDSYLNIGYDNPHNFHIKNIRIYDRALTTTEIEEIVSKYY